ncbi:MAG: SMP-30/gluconolactonase/LRE family protein [Pirellula sp.]|nr:SMP-30/gluconolactonase/LRE family protein [Pirellula sp.]
MSFRFFLCSLALLMMTGSTNAQHAGPVRTIGSIERLQPELDSVLSPDARLEVVADGFTWTEGPLWMGDTTSGYLLFTDIPRNSIFSWTKAHGISLFMQPSGYTGVTYYGLEPGANGLLKDSDGNLVMCEHGDRRVSVLTPGGGKRTLADHYQGKRFNSPNDGVLKSNGDIYFTDPPYGLPMRENDPRREMDFCGVYRISKGTNAVTLLTTELERPNGIGFSPDEKTLYVAQSDPKRAIWMAFPVKSDGTLGTGKLFYDATDQVGKQPGLPDGLSVDQQGNVWASGPGGIYIFNGQGKLLGRILTGERTSNCCFGEDGSTLFITADSYLCRISIKTKGNP